MSEKLEALFTDLDCSLLNDDKEIGQEDIRTINKLKNKGIKVFFATGRHYIMTKYYHSLVSPCLPFITSNGAMIYDFDNKKSLYSKPIPLEIVKKIKKFADVNDMNMYFYTESKMYFPKDDTNSEYNKCHEKASLKLDPEDCEIVDNTYIPQNENIIKLLYSKCPSDVYNKLCDTLPDVCNELEIAFSGHNFLDMTSKGQTKGNAIKKLAEQYGFSLENAMALGDNFNDISMLEIVGKAVTPETACEDIKKYADFVTSSNNDNPLTHAIKNLYPYLLD